MKKEAFWTFLEHKSEEYDKVSNYAGNSTDKEVDNYFTLDAPERNLEVKE